MTDLNIVPKKNVPVNYAYVTKEIICVKYYICLQKFETGPKFSRFGTNIPNFKKLKKKLRIKCSDELEGMIEYIY